MGINQEASGNPERETQVGVTLEKGWVPASPCGSCDERQGRTEFEGEGFERDGFTMSV